MPNKTNTSRARVSKNTSKGGFKFRWWMGLGLVIVVAVVGVLVLRFSKAGTAALVGNPGPYGTQTCTARVNLTHNYSKGTSQTANVCMKRSDLSNGLNPLVSDSIQLNPGRPANYCIWGRAQAATAKATNINLYLRKGTETVGKSSSWIGGAINEVQGYGNQFTTSGGNNRLICAYTSSPNITGFDVEATSYSYPYSATNLPGTAGQAHYVENIMFYDNVSIE